MMKKKVLPIIIGAGCGLLLIVAAVIVVINIVKNNANRINYDDYRFVEVYESDGDVLLSREGKDSDVYEGMRLITKDTVKTGDDSEVELLVDDDKHILAKENTKFRIDAKGSSKKGSVKVSLVSGEGIFTIDEKLKEEDSFEVVTPNATMSVRGTKFSVQYDKKNKTTFVEVFDGTVWVESYQGDYELGEGESITIVGEDYDDAKNGAEGPADMMGPDKTAGNILFGSDGSAIVMVLADQDNILVPFISASLSYDKNGGFEQYEHETLVSQYWNESNSGAVTSLVVYQYDEFTIVSVATLCTSAAGPNKPTTSVDINVFDCSLEDGLTRILHSAIVDSYDQLNSTYTYDFTERQFRTGIGNTIGDKYGECSKDEFMASISQYGLELGEDYVLVANEEQRYPQYFDVSQIISSSPVIYSISGRNVGMPTDYATLIGEHGDNK